MKEIKKIFEEFNDLNRLEIENDLIANKARKLFEKVMRIKLEINDEYFSLKEAWGDYNKRFKPEGVKYTGEEIIRKLNKYSHYRETKLPDEEIYSILSKLNKIFEVVLSVKNPRFDISQNVIDLYKDLNDDQKKAIQSNARVTLVNAGPGTGKTHLIVHRIIKTGTEFPEKKIVGLSFTNQAAINLKERVEYELFGTEHYKLRKNVFIGTIHSFALRMLQDYYKDVLKEDFEYDVVDEQELKEINIEFNKNRYLIKDYLEENKLLTFNDILKKFMGELNDNKVFIDYIAANIQEFVIDEAQDLDRKQYDILKIMYDYSDNINQFLVGDPRQNIFGFNGGSLDNLFQSFDRKNVKEKDLTISYRVPQKVLEFVNSFVFMDCTNISMSNPNFSGDSPELYELPNKQLEAEKIGGIIRQITELENGKFHDIAVLSPSSFYFKEIAEELNKQEIPFKIFGGETILRGEIRFLLNVIKAIKLNNAHSLKKALAYLDPDIKISGSRFHLVLKRLDEMDGAISEDVKLVIEFIKEYLDSDDDAWTIINHFITYGKEKRLFSAEVLNYFRLLSLKLAKIDKYDINEISVSLSPNNEDFTMFYRKTADFTFEKEIKENDYVTLSTIHSAKGKEWDYVIIPGLSQDTFPRYNTDDLNAELKKFYVACTRTLRKLYFTRPVSITVSNNRGTWTFNKGRSIFIRDL
jgi:DNA helicase-2/ATP-dependent DNA helicase PcrA